MQQLTPESAVAQGMALRESTASNARELAISALRGTLADLAPRAVPAEGVVPDGSR